MPWDNTQKIAILRDRATMLAKSRAFFSERNVLEVDCPILSPAAAIDAHIDLITARFAGEKSYYLHSSPEYGMKRLLADGIGDIYQLSHVFRDNECSPKHNPEFTMTEWYRLGMTFQDLMEETLDYVRLFVGDLPHTIITYREALKKYADIDYVNSTENDLISYLQKHQIKTYAGIESEGKDALLNIILGIFVEPFLGADGLCALAYYPSTQAALAQTAQHQDETVAERFEVYYKGVELANGYHELAEPHEQRKRFQEANVERLKLNKESLPIDEDFLKALEKGLPDCCGVAVGFDRLMMLRHNVQDISNVIPIPWI